MLYASDSPLNDGALTSSSGSVWQTFATAVAAENPPEEKSAEVRYFEERARRELELAAAATNPKAEAIHLELVHAYRQRAREVRPLPEISSWLDEGGANLPWD